MTTKISNNPAFIRELRNLLESESLYISGISMKIEKLIKKYEDSGEMK